MANYDEFTSVEFSKQLENEEVGERIVRKRDKKSSISVQDSEDGRKDSRKNSLLGFFKRLVCCSKNQYSKNSVGSKKRKYLPDHLKEYLVFSPDCDSNGRTSRFSKATPASTTNSENCNDIFALPPCLEICEIDPKNRPNKSNTKQIEIIESNELGSYERVLNKSRRAMSLTHNKSVGIFLSRFRERKSNISTSSNLFRPILVSSLTKNENSLSSGCSSHDES
ncbi:unnamed protein product [Moneuplotes crassus]|uniref:Uncharacterized protein n=1 Tax=Euplotes crassus TaxID=5936 RepID=A0AAD1USV8_EUPCR|nr:unnamed protein product [Moneuplotes crassus]